MKLLILSLAPVFIIAVYVYYRDKYEREPLGLLLKSLLSGGIIILPVFFIEKFLISVQPPMSHSYSAFYNAFVVAASTEELFKFAALFLLIWQNKNFNEKFDGIVYAVFISLGFAAVENVMYVFNYGEQTGWTRAITAVPAHALFGVTMGFYFGLAKYYPAQRSRLMVKALLFPVVLHGIYDFILMKQDMRLMTIFIPFVIYLWFMGLRKMKNLSDRSIYR